jgi:hypothetical protein
MVALLRQGLDRKSLVQGDTPERAEDSSDWVPGRTSESLAEEAGRMRAEARMRHFPARQVAEIVIVRRMKRGRTRDKA